MIERSNETKARALYAAVALLTGAVFAGDLLTQLGIAVWVFYLVPLAICLFLPHPLLPIVLAGVITALVAITTFTDVTTDQSGYGPLNRALGLVMIWGLAVIERQLVQSRTRLVSEEWLRRGHARVLEVVQGEKSTVQVGKLALEVLCEWTGSALGALYVLEGGVYRLVSTHGVSGDVSGTEIFQPGEGIVGHVAQNRVARLIEEVPENFFPVRTALGSATPRHLQVAPLVVDGVSSGVVELGSFSRPSSQHVALLQRISEPLGIVVRTAQYRARLRELLEESQRQSESLQTQQEELRVANEELSDQSRALGESQARLEVQQAELEQTNTQLESQTQLLEKQKDELARSKNAAERSSRYKSEFLANMSHELRTPLNSALILARILADNREGNLLPEQIQYAETIYSAGNDLLALINDILDLSKIEAGRMEIRTAQAPVSRLLESLRQTFEPLASQKKLTLAVTLAPGAPEQITVDAQRLEQILKNLLSNAIKFTSEGEVSLTVEPRGADRVAFVVRDSGIGISPQQRAVIFEAFRQADGTTNRKYGGTGLGLSISRELAQLLGGQIELDSEPGQGSVFTLTLPVIWSENVLSPSVRRRMESEPEAPPPPTPARDRRTINERPSRQARAPATAPRPTPLPRPAPLTSPGEARRAVKDDRDHLTRHHRLILVVEDDLAFARILHGMAHELDFDCIVETTAEEALKSARTFQPSGILLDVGLPDSSGLSLLERFKGDSATRHIPVHVISASDYTQAALEMGAIGYALKPVVRERILEAMQKLEERLTKRLRRVLVVEDDATLRESTAKLLGAQDVEISTAGTAAEALEALEHRSFDCMVLDLKLPDASGYELLERMAEGDQYSFPPVIVYTGRDLDREEEARLRRYSRSIIIKGARSPERLLDEVTLFLHQVESDLPPDRQRMLRESRLREGVFEGKRILIVEDDVRNVFALSHVLEPKGAKVEIARNGREALEFLEHSPDVDLVLMDVMMPEMDGLTATRKIREQSHLEKLPIIVLTAKAMKDDQEQALEAGANDYMSKPVDVDKLLSLCRVWMAR